MEKEIFESPIAEIYMFETADIVTTSAKDDEWTGDYIIPND